MIINTIKLLVSACKNFTPGFRNNCRYSNSGGFNIIELMIVVLIIGILASVALPLYISYIQKSRVRALVYPGLHIIETNIGLYYSMRGAMPPASMLSSMQREADTTYFIPEILGNTLKITIDSPPGDPDRGKLSKMHGMPMYLTPDTKHETKISNWLLSGTLANHLGIQSGSP